MQYLDINTVAGPGSVKFSTVINGKKKTIIFKGNNLETQNIGESIICAFLPVCMKINSDLHTNYSLSSVLLESTDKIQSIYNTWNSKMQAVGVIAKKRKPMKRGKKVAAFFSCGIDSFDTLLRHIKEIDVLVYIEGYDIWLNEKKYLSSMRNKIKRVAKNYKKDIIFLKSNLHSEMDEVIEWGTYYHGAALAAAAYLLPKEIGKVYIPSTFTYSSLFPWGSHPLLDELWGDGSLEIVHDGAELTRAQKVINVYSEESDFPNNFVRVCLGDRSKGDYNCSACEKCIRTITVIGLLKQKIKPKTFVSFENFSKLIDYYSTTSINSMTVMRMAETITFFRNNPQLADGQKLSLLEIKFQEIIKLGLPISFYAETTPYIPSDLLQEPKIRDIVNNKAKIIFKKLKNIPNSIKHIAGKSGPLAMKTYQSQNIIRRKNLKRILGIKS